MAASWPNAAQEPFLFGLRKQIFEHLYIVALCGPLANIENPDVVYVYNPCEMALFRATLAVC